ncbi:hypothetical protein PT189_07320 [Erysipelothrix rhusiopathiae]|uniref:hypothetical protein n=1 Tax=Erysipelothrix rhusiopathiae TaxID=1648 RepID=UPI0023B1A2EC|nr:hypothetical protein [Erysipelothrix rhusiopathiae]MDE8203863.1 hypothetical protein [Erysipelothrix rhusiopathiae]MDE8258475.1 hypothetical protein [Erysipelothrix rhusiopathiae]MDE8272361.1 hypothetical protein [Erysipelothrix rhusiopathiae]MDE8301481.1 hypothetical protein [Erysipelothrix rhusiopathiae]
MSDVNYIKGQLDSWKQCINWLEEKYPEKKFELDHKLHNIKGISYEEKQVGLFSNESIRRSIIIDQLNELEFEREYCESVVAFCERIVKKVKPQYQNIFIYRYRTNSTISWICYKTDYSKSRVYEIIEQETKRLSNE